MTLPRRWLEDDDAPGAVRAALRPGRAGMDPPEGAQQAVWLALAAQIGAAGAATAAAKAAASASAKAAAGAGAGASAGAAVTAGAASGGLLKAILIGAIAGVVAVTGYSALEPSPPPPGPVAPPVTEPSPPPGDAPAALQGNGAPAPSAEPSSSPGPSAEPPAGAHEPPSSAGGAPAAQPARSSDPPAGAQQAAGDAESSAGAASPAPGSAEERASRLREENDLLGQARGALRSGDPGRALAILEQARKKFPDGVLGQEREAVAIEALAKSGAREAASARAAAFIQAHPTSPHAARLQAFVLR